MHEHPVSKVTSNLYSTQSGGVRAAPDAKKERLQIIRDKIEAREELLSRPQRFSASRPLSRREMEIEQALFQGNERLGFLTALYHRGTSAETRGGRAELYLLCNVKSQTGNYKRDVAEKLLQV